METSRNKDNHRTNRGMAIASSSRKKLIVVSHERSGTHFLMNTLACNFGYIAAPPINFDSGLGLNFHSTEALRQFFLTLHGKPVLNIVKSHHQAEFLRGCLDFLTQEFYIFYIARDPRDVMASFWRLIRNLPWDEGPKTATVGDFMRAEPCGGILRYQKTQLPTILHRWEANVKGWLDLIDAEEVPGINLIRYEDLNSAFDSTLGKIAQMIDQPLVNPARPQTDKDVVVPGPGRTGGHRDLFTAEDNEFVLKTVGDTMERLTIPVR